MNEITLDDNEGWSDPCWEIKGDELKGLDSSIEHYFIRIPGLMYGKSLCGRFMDFAFQWFNPDKDKNELEKIFDEPVKVCLKCNELLKSRKQQKGLTEFF